MRLLKRVFWASVILIVTAFAFVNFQSVELNVDPLGLFRTEQSVEVGYATSRARIEVFDEAASRAGASDRSAWIDDVLAKELERLDLAVSDVERPAPLRLPLAVVIIGTLALGLVVGVLLAYDATRPTYRALAAERREARLLRRENARVVDALKAVDSPESAGPPATRL